MDNPGKLYFEMSDFSRKSKKGADVRAQYFGIIFWMSLPAKRGNLFERNYVTRGMKISFL
jgi:hypothetical protein